MTVTFKYSIAQNVFTGLYDALLLGGEYANLHGYGTTPEEALISLKLTLRARRRLDGVGA